MLAPGDEVAGRYQVVSLLGEGGMARVYRVRHLALGGEHALKLLTLQHPRLKQRLLREGRIQAQLAHPNVVKVIDVLEHDGQTGLLMEYVDCITLDDLLGMRGLLFDEAIRLIAQILAGVTAAHDAGVLHRDLKPANVLLSRRAGSEGFIAKVTDFGIAKVLEPDVKKGMTRMGALMGTPGYMAPEQARDSASVDARADVFALGVIAYESIAGFPPYSADDVELAVSRARDHGWLPLNEIVPDCPEAVAQSIERALSFDREERFADAYAFGTALLRAHPELFASLRSAGPPPSMALPGVRMPNESTGAAEAASLGATFEPLAEPDRRRPAWLFAAVLGGASLVLLVLAGVLVGLRATTPEVAPPPAAVAAPSTPERPKPRGRPDGAVRVDRAAPAPTAPSGVATPPAEVVDPAPAPTPAATEPARRPVPDGPPTADPGPEPTDAPVDPVEVAEAPPEDPPADDGVAEVAPEPEPSPAPALPQVVGRWSGTAANRPLTILVTQQDGSALRADVTILVGPTERTDTYGGTIGADGAIELTQDGGAMTVFRGSVSGGSMQGTYTARGARRPQDWSVRR